MKTARRRIWASALAPILALSLAAGMNALQEQPDREDQNVTYTITDLGTLGGTSSVGCGLNSRGEVVGFSSIVTGQSHAFQWSNGEMTDLGTLPGDFFSEGRDINKHGQVVGDSTVKFFTPPFHAVLFENGEVKPLGTLGGPGSFAVAINQRGQVVGASRTVSGQLHAFLWEDGVMTDLGALPGETASVARAINKRGQVVGNSAPLPLGFFGDCPTTPRPVQPWHAALWDRRTCLPFSRRHDDRSRHARWHLQPRQPDQQSRAGSRLIENCQRRTPRLPLAGWRDDRPQ